MSLKSYLFLLITILIMIVAGLQFYFVEKVRLQVNDEISSKSEAISQVALSAITDVSRSRINQTFNEYLTDQSINKLLLNKANEPLKIVIKKTPNRSIKLSEDLVMHTGAATQTIEVFTDYGLQAQQALTPALIAQKVDASILPHIESTSINAMILRDKSDAYKLEFVFNNDDANFQKFVSFKQDENSIDRYFSQLRWQLIAFTLLAFVLAYFLARHVSKPLSQLGNGFEALGKGQLGIQIPISGVKELRNTIDKFNKTSRRLHDLQDIEKQYHQQQQMAELGEVARGLAHTLRNPLNTIGLGVSQIQEPSTSEKEKQLIAEQIQEKISLLDNTIKTLMHLANSDVDRSKQIDLVSIVNDIILEVKLTKHTEISLQSSAENIYICGAESEIRAMFHALISNAIEANLEAKTKSNVEVHLSQTTNGIQFEVIDQGLGIRGIEQDDLFKPHITTKASGAGMGLFIVKRICELYYQGNVSIQNNEYYGCHAKLVLHDAKRNNEAVENA